MKRELVDLRSHDYLARELDASRESAESLAAQVLALHDVLKGFLHDADAGELPSRGLRDKARQILYGAPNTDSGERE